MAVEVANQKDLFKHAITLSTLTFGLALLLVLAVQQVQLGNTKGAEALGRGLTTHLVEIRPSSNGLGEVSLHDQLNDKPAGIGDASEAGRAAQFSFSFR